MPLFYLSHMVSPSVFMGTFIVPMKTLGGSDN